MTGSPAAFTRVLNGRSIDVASIPAVPHAPFADALLAAVADGQRVASCFGARAGTRAGASAGARAGADDPVELFAVLADDARSELHVGRTRVESGVFPSLTPRCPQVHLFEREIHEQFGLLPEGHPWLKPVRFQRPFGRPRGDAAPPEIGVADFYRVEGEEVHEVAVGPVHAGVIEPGHFRFQCHGEQVLHLEISLGYQHRGVERALAGGPDKRTVHYAETLAGDATVSHATACCQVLEALARVQKPARAQSLRGVALELERLANHVGDLGALANDVGFLPTAAYCGRIRGAFLNMTASLCGSRFGRGLVRPGGVGFDAEPARVAELLASLDAEEKDTANAVNLLWEASSVMARFEGTGTLPASVCRELGIVGPVARASGLDRDARHDQPCGIFRFAHVPVATCDSGDVFARAYVRWLEIQRSITFVREQLRALPQGPIRSAMRPLEGNRLAVAVVESWRGEVCHVAITDPTGRIDRYKVCDPSFHNWAGLAYALRNQEISDFPLCNKSFNLSYCGHDL